MLRNNSQLLPVSFCANRVVYPQHMLKRHMDEVLAAASPLALFGRRLRALVDRMPDVNVVEAMIVLSRGGSRMAPWVRALTRPDAFEDVEPLANNVVLSLFNATFADIRNYRVIPATRSEVFAVFLATNICSTSHQLADACGISIQTAITWMFKAEEVNLVAKASVAGTNYYIHTKPFDQIWFGEFWNSARGLNLPAKCQALIADSDWLENSRLTTYLRSTHGSASLSEARRRFH